MATLHQTEVEFHRVGSEIAKLIWPYNVPNRPGVR